MKTITQHILVSVLITVLAVLGGWGYLELRQTLRVEQERILRTRQGDAEQLAIGLVYPLWNLNQAEVGKSISAVASDENTQAILVRDEDGNVYAGVIKADPGTARLETFDPGNPLHQRLVSRNAHQTSRDILKGTQVIGKVTIYEDPGPLEALLRTQRTELLLKLLSMMLALALVQFLVLRAVVIRPLTRLKEWVASIAPGQRPSTPARSGCEEIGVLAASFAGLAEHLTGSLLAQERDRTLLRAIMDNTFQLQALLSPDGRLLEVNEASLRLVGCAPEKVLGEAFWETPWWIHDAAQAEGLRQAVARAAGGELVRFKSAHVDVHGETRYLDSSLKPLWDEAGNLMYLLSEGRDITEQLEAEETLRVLIANIPGAIYRCEVQPPRRMHVCSEGFRTVLGRPPSDFLEGRITYASIIHPDDRELVDQAVARAIELRQSYEITYRVLHADGSEHWVWERGQAHFRRDGQPEWLDGVIQDITERRQIERDLQTTLARIQLILGSVNLGVYEWNIRTGSNRIFNPSFIHSLGYEQDEFPVTYEAWKKLIHPDDLARIEAETQAGWRSDVDIVVEFRMRTKSGDWRWIMGRGRVIEWDEAGEPVRLVGTDIDISERKQSEERQQALEAQLRQAQKLEAIGQLAGGVAHDINNMISAMLGHLELVRDQLPEEHPVHRNLQTIEKAAYRSRDIMRQLLAFSRRQAIEPQILDLNTLVPEIQKGLLPLIGEDIQIVFRPEARLWPVKMDPTQVEQIVLNLVVNARDAMPQGGQILLETANVTLDAAFCEIHLMAAPGPYALISVTDSGSGMDEATLVRIFEPFFTTKGEGRGTGLGLATVFGIAQQNRGFIDVQSVVGQGTVFRVYIPAVSEGAGQKSRDETIQVSRGSGTILLVEDDEGLRNVLTRVIAKMGYKVVAADSPTQALALGEQPEVEIDLLLTDVVMPIMSGNELRVQMESRRPGLKTLLMSGYTMEQLHAKGVTDTGLHLIAKPFNTPELSRQIAKILAESKAAEPGMQQAGAMEKG